MTDHVTQLYRFTRREGPPDTTGYGSGRRFLLVQTVEDTYLVTLPSPWTDVGQGDDAAVEVMVNSRQGSTGSPIAVTVRDSAIGTGLAYMSSGALYRAATVFEGVQSMLNGKDNHLAAAAGAYIHLGIDTDEEPGPGDDPIANLRWEFPQMSDGSILWAVRKLRLARSEAEVEEARDALSEAYNRGVPVYTLGLSWLIDALSEFPEDDQCSQMLDQVRRLSWRVDMREPFVILRVNAD